MAFRLVCPAYVPDKVGHGTDAGYSPGGAYDHATRCAAMGDLLRERDIDVETRATGRKGVETADDFFAAIVAKSAAKSEPVAASAAEPVETVTIDGVTYRKA